MEPTHAGIETGKQGHSGGTRGRHLQLADLKNRVKPVGIEHARRSAGANGVPLPSIFSALQQPRTRSLLLYSPSRK